MDNTLVQTDRAEDGTHVRRFLAHRGAVVIRESRDIGEVKGQYGDKLTLSTTVLSIVKGVHRELSHGVRLERYDRESEASAFLDFDELPELIESFDFIAALTERVAAEQTDYTEVAYATKDNIRFGFFQKDGQQQGFVAVEPIRGTVFLPTQQLGLIKNLLVTARTHLISRGAAE